MIDLLLFLARSLVDDPDAVSVTEATEEGALVFKLRVGPQDLGKVIGKGGRTARAMRIVLSAVAARDHRRVLVDIVE